MAQVKPFNYYGIGGLNGANPYIMDKGKSFSFYNELMLDKSCQMFKYTGLPDSIPKRDLERIQQTQGFVAIIEHEGELYAVYGGLGGEPNVYYRPTKLVVANPALNLSKTYTIGEDCVVIPNDAEYMGLLPIYSRYAEILTEMDITIRLAAIQSRMRTTLAASDDRTAESAKTYLKQVEDGKLGIIQEQAFTEGIKNVDIGANEALIHSYIEMTQYQRALMHNELGMSANYNMKSEYVSTVESQMNNDALIPLIENMLEQRQLGWDAANRMFGINVTVDLDSVWRVRNENTLMTLEEELELENSLNTNTDEQIETEGTDSDRDGAVQPAGE